MTEQEVTEYLLGIPRFSKKTTLDNLRQYLDELEHPENRIKTIHVAGTNGKGSVCAFLGTMLTSSGIKTGVFTSPHLVKMEERIRIGDTLISSEDFVSEFGKIKHLTEKMMAAGREHPSFFEFLFLMAADYFAAAGAEYAIFETGLGGRLDATNVIAKPEVCVITSISYDHTEILGEPLTEIAGEKAGIIKEHVPAVFYHSSDEAAAVIRTKAEEKHAPLLELKEEDVNFGKISSKRVDFSLENRYYNVCDVTVPYSAPYQAVNCSLALLAFHVLSQKEEALKKIVHPEQFCAKTVWEGRMEEVAPGIYLDGAHNLSGISEFVRAVKTDASCKERYLLFSVVTEKDYEHMIQLLVKDRLWSKIWICTIDNHRAVSGNKIGEIFRKYTDCEVRIFEKASAAFEDAILERTEDTALYCAGSLYLIGELKEYIAVRNAERNRS